MLGFPPTGPLAAPDRAEIKALSTTGKPPA